MKRRDFIRAAGVSAVGVTALKAKAVERESSPAQSGMRKRARMRIGAQRRPVNEELLNFYARHGVDGICGYPQLKENRRWNLDEVLRLRERIEKHGLTFDLASFRLTSGGIENQVFPNILLGNDPERDRDIDCVCSIIETAARAGIHCLKYNMALLPVLRTEDTPGRGGSAYRTWIYERAPDKDIPHPVAGVVPPELFWERITYFLERVIPVAEQNKVRMACHPHDPGVPPQGYRGVYRVLGDVEGLKRFEQIVKSPYHGFNLCMGTVSEMLENPAEELLPVIRYFGERKKLFNIHYRNIVGKRNNFYEVYPDNGDVDMHKVMQTLMEVDYPYLVMPDHMPRHPDDPLRRQAYAYGFGYIRAMIQAVDATG